MAIVTLQKQNVIDCGSIGYYTAELQMVCLQTLTIFPNDWMIKCQMDLGVVAAGMFSISLL